uniref:Gustatory receptor n=1 Tax=Panagrolaimus sp. JU765 TaxID=591449 RepID=A0AC34QAK5_9BILA
MIVAIIWIIHTLYCQTYDQKKQDDRLLTKIEFRKKEVRFYSAAVRYTAYNKTNFLFDLFLDAEVIGVTTFLLAAVGGTRRQTSIASTADLLFTVVLLSKLTKRWFNDTTTKTEDQVKSRFLLDVVVRKSTSIFELFAYKLCIYRAVQISKHTGKNQALLIWWDTFFILDLSLDIFDGVAGFNFKSDGFSCESLNKDLHLGLYLKIKG